MLFKTEIESKVSDPILVQRCSKTHPPVKNVLSLGALQAGMQNMQRARDERPGNTSNFDFQNDNQSIPSIVLLSLLLTKHSYKTRINITDNFIKHNFSTGCSSINNIHKFRQVVCEFSLWGATSCVAVISCTKASFP